MGRGNNSAGFGEHTALSAHTKQSSTYQTELAAETTDFSIDNFLTCKKNLHESLNPLLLRTMTRDELQIWLQTVCARLVCPVGDCQAARWHARYAPPIQHGERRRHPLLFWTPLLSMHSSGHMEVLKQTFQMRSVLVYIIGLTVHLLWHGSIIALLITLHKLYNTAQSEFNFLLIWELVCAQSVLEQNPPTIVPGRDNILPGQSYRTHTAFGDKNGKGAMVEWWLAGEIWTNLKTPRLRVTSSITCDWTRVTTVRIRHLIACAGTTIFALYTHKNVL